jgi:hypothetical protein
VEELTQREGQSARDSDERWRWEQSCRRSDECDSPRRPKIKPAAKQTSFLRCQLQWFRLADSYSKSLKTLTPEPNLIQTLLSELS